MSQSKRIDDSTEELVKFPDPIANDFTLTSLTLGWEAIFTKKRMSWLFKDSLGLCLFTYIIIHSASLLLKVT